MQLKPLFLFCIMLDATCLYAQLSGPASANAGTASTYSYTSTTAISPEWSVSGSGTVNSTSSSGKTYSASITFTNSGSYTVYVGSSSGGLLASMSVSVLPQAPTGTGAARCGTGTVTLSATPGLGGDQVRWYTFKGTTVLYTGNSYTTPSLSSTTTYYASTYSSSSSLETSSLLRTAVIATVTPDLVAGTVAGDQTLCYNADAAAFTSSAGASGGTGSYAYQWQWRVPAGSWASISGATATSYDPGLLTQTREFRRMVTSGTCTQYSNTVTVTVYPDLAAGSVSGDQEICAGTDAAAFSSTAGATGGTGTYAYQWQWRIPAGAWADISGASGSTYDQGTLAVTTEFRRQASSCGAVGYSNTVVINVDPATVGGTVSGGTETYGVASGTLTLTGYTGTVQKWQTKTAVGAWTDVGNTGTTQAYANLTSTLYYRAVLQSGVCPTANSSEGAVIVYPVPTVSIEGPAVLAPGSSVDIVTDGDLYSYQWYSGETALPGETAGRLTVTRPGSYKVTVRHTSAGPSYTTGYALITGSTQEQQDVNYVRTTEFNKQGATDDLYGLSENDFTMATDFFDGLGRPVQRVQLGGGGNGKDLILPMAYDPFGREAEKYLPYTYSGRDGRYRAGAVAEQSSFYSGGTATVPADSAPYALTVFEPSPLNRVLKQGAPGTVWQPNGDPSDLSDRTVKKGYSVSRASDSVLLFTYDRASGLVLAMAGAGVPQYYAAGQLVVNLTLDEHGNEAAEFADKEGRTVLRKVQYAATAGGAKLYACTYYVYDQFGNLSVVLQPEGVARLKIDLGIN